MTPQILIGYKQPNGKVKTLKRIPIETMTYEDMVEAMPEITEVILTKFQEWENDDE